MLSSDAVIDTVCVDCQEKMRVEIAHGQVSGDPAVVHFAVAARDWWKDIVDT